MYGRRYFEGWYIKHQNADGTLALIPGVSADARGRRTAFVQVITHRGVYQADYPYESFSADRRHFRLRVGDCLFGPAGARIDIDRPDFRCRGELAYGPFTPLRYDIMGPFCAVPFMECRHGVVSMGHTVDGEVELDGERYLFERDAGYIETDRGRSFPQSYAWVQCNGFAGPRDSVMAAVATIPMGQVRFTGCLCALTLGGRETRLASYLGARVQKTREDCIRIRQGNLLFEAQRLAGQTQPLRAPLGGAMSCVIHEAARCTVRLRLLRGERVLWENTCDSAAFERVDSLTASRYNG